MNKFLIAVVIAIFALSFTGLGHDFIHLFKDEQGRTNWQYVANWSSGVLIILLSITAIILFFSRQAKDKANLELEEIKSDLEVRVRERTAELKASEHYINAILKSMPTMLVGLDPKGRVTQWNQQAEKYTGLNLDDVRGKDLWDAYPIITITRDQVNDALAKSEKTTIRQSQRGLFHFDITIFPLHQAGESGVVLLLDDVSQQVKSENQLIQRDKISSMGELASSMAHDMDTPLQSMLADINDIETQIDKLSKKIDPNEAIDTITNRLTHAHKKGKQAGAIIANLLDFAGAQLTDKQQADMRKIMDHAINIAQNILTLPNGINFRDIKIEREYDDNVPMVNCHQAEIQQVYLSLLRHCFHAISKTEKNDFEPKINIRILEGYESLWLKISHNGLGLTLEEQQSIFEPFFSSSPLDSEEDADKRLSFSHFVITEQHSAEMAVTSDVDVGSTFHIQFR